MNTKFAVVANYVLLVRLHRLEPDIALQPKQVIEHQQLTAYRSSQGELQTRPHCGRTRRKPMLRFEKTRSHQETSMHPEDLMKADWLSAALLVSVGVVMLSALVLVLAAMLMQA